MFCNASIKEEVSPNQTALFAQCNTFAFLFIDFALPSHPYNSRDHVLGKQLNYYSNAESKT